MQVPGRAGGLGGGGWLALQGPRPQPGAGRQLPLLQEQEERLGRRGLPGRRQVEGHGDTVIFKQCVSSNVVVLWIHCTQYFLSTVHLNINFPNCCRCCCCCCSRSPQMPSCDWSSVKLWSYPATFIHNFQISVKTIQIILHPEW